MHTCMCGCALCLFVCVFVCACVVCLTVCLSVSVCSCGSGLSGECLTENGHVWVGLDISPHMLGEA